MAIGSPTTDQGLYLIPAMAEADHGEARFLRRGLREVDSYDLGRISSPQPDDRRDETLDAPPAECELLPPRDSMGAIRGLVFVLGFYAVMAVLGLSGFMLWDWLR